MKTVLVIDDEQGITLSIELVLADEYRVLKASTGEDGLLLAKNCKPDLILMDIMMPGIGGLEALKMLKTHPDLKRTPVIIMSGAHPLARQEDYRWAEFLNKPFSGDDLIKAIKKLI